MLESIYLYLNFIGYKVVKINDIKINHKINEHSKMYFSACLEEKVGEDSVFTTKQGSQVELSSKNKKVPTIFKGMIQTIQVKKLSDVFHIELLAISNTFQMDAKRIRKSFQDKDMPYSAMVREIIGKYPGSDFAYRTSDENIGKFTMQYEETDWEFIKRMSSRFNQGLVADAMFNTPKFTFGIPQGTDRGKLEQYNFYMRKNIGSYMISSQNTNPSITELDAVEYCVQTEQEFLIGDFISFQDVNNLYIKAVEANMINGVLIFDYILSTKNGLTIDKLYNEKTIGLALKGRVIEVIQDTVKVHLEIDESQDKGKAWKFPYTTMYTAEGNSGWYCMPELEDTVFIYFPTKEEDKGVGVNSIRVKGGGGDKISDPDTKYFRTANGKELKFSPEEILITCCDFENKKTGEKNKIFIRLNEKSGIEISSTKPISVKTDADLTIDSKKKITITAKEEIKLKCKTSQILMDDKIDIAGKVVKIN